MKLYYSNTSPYSRKVRIVLREKGLMSQVEEIAVNPFANDAKLNSLNPLGKIPVLIDDEETVFFDSPLICQYVDSLDSDVYIIPVCGSWQHLQNQALADGLIDAAYQIVIETRRPENLQSAQWIAQWQQDIQRSLLAMNKLQHYLGGDINLSQISFATALGYLEFRLPDLLSKSSEFGALLEWYDSIKKRPSLIETMPTGG